MSEREILRDLIATLIDRETGFDGGWGKPAHLDVLNRLKDETAKECLGHLTSKSPG